jgi:aminoglycoside/choline kinase family phosphotransferase
VNAVLDDRFLNIVLPYKPLGVEDPVRLNALNLFIEQQGLDGDIGSLAKDMSNRQYYRLQSAERTFVIMDAPPPEKPAQFILLADFLIKQGLRAPQILGFDEENGFVLLEDFGDKTFTRVLESAALKGDDAFKVVEKKLYETAVNVLHSVKNCQRPMAIEDYTPTKLLAEVEIFIDWYWPYAKGGAAPAIAKKPFMALWENLFQSMPQTPKTIVMRDFHSDNLMVIDKPFSIQTCGVLDFQDALWGSVVYDHISLLEDARRDVSAEVVEICSKQFLAAYPANLHDALETTAKILAAGRHVKVIGVFTRYALRQNNDSKCIHLPRLWRYLQQHFKDPIFAPIAGWFDMYCPLDLQYLVTPQKHAVVQ